MISIEDCLAEGDFELISEIRMPSLMKSAQDLSSLSEKVSPGSSGMVAMSVAALSFSPQMAPFDLTLPIQVLGFSSKKGNSKSFEWCLVLERKKDIPLNNSLKDMKEPVYLKEIGGKGLLTYSKSLSESITSIPKSEEDAIESDPNIILILYPEKYFSSFPEGLETFKNEMIRQIIQKKGREEEDFNEITFLNLKLGAFENFLRQCGKFEMDISFCEESIKINTEFSTSKGSPTEKFLDSQTFKGKYKKDILDSNEFVSCGHISITDDLKSSIVNMTKEAMVETSDEANPDITDLFSILTDKFSGNFKFFMKSFAPGSPVCLEIQATDEKQKELRTFISGRKNIEDAGNGIFRFKKGNKESKFNFFLVMQKNKIKVVYGKIASTYDEKLISTESPAAGAAPANDADIYVDAYSSAVKELPMFSSKLTFAEKSLIINTEIFMEGIKRTIPPELMKNQQNLNQE
ncbi:MAG: hypothetical protein A2X45_24440 [Lentisphaerae bacterium GWF2_50_93]|nr:MAG: hypothetical protein A2X45_24440 [Lentisphaerae bacterium GWF2_50_93]